MKEYCFKIGNLMIHNKEQWDRNDYIPFVCLHWVTADESRRLFIL